MPKCGCGCSRMIGIDRLIAGFTLMVCLLGGTNAALAETRVSVLYPESAPAFVRLYQAIIDGMATASDVRVQSRAVSERSSPNEVKAWLLEQRSQVTVTLGDVPPALTEQLPANTPLIYGASALNDNTQSGVSLAASPARMFERLRLVTPDVERVFVLYRPQASGWLIAAARPAAREQGLELAATACEDAQQASAAIARILQQARPGRDAVWLTLDPVVPLNQLLPVLLRESWDRHLVLFSNNPMDVAKGALFALYPDYPAMGRQLAERAKRQAAKSSLSGPEASEHLRGAFNTRTASHLGIEPSDRVLKSFDRTFPEEQR
jgi:putative tryptophan/tyrosine transport system substrate-binding protein